jgi:predicted Zn-dependent peptidase
MEDLWVVDWGEVVDIIVVMKVNPKIVKVGNLRVILVPDDRQSVTVRAMIGSGSREESDIEAGSAHFLEHFVFKGTTEYPGMFDINDAVESVGGSFNAYTGQNEMGFWVKMAKEHLDRALSIVGQVLTEAVLPEEHFDKERGIILEELYMYQDRPMSKAMEELSALVYGQSNLGRPIIGTVESLKGMTVEALRAYKDKWFVAQNTILGVVGNYGDEQALLTAIERHFEGLVRCGRAMPDRDVFVWPGKSQRQTKLVNRKLDQASVTIGYPGMGIRDERKYPLEVLSIVLGDGWLSRLVREVREKRGWAYAIGNYVDSYSDVGDVVIGAGLPKDKLSEAVGLIEEIVYSLAGGKWQVTEDDVRVAKDCFRGRLALYYDKPEQVLGRALEDLMFVGEIEGFERLVEKVEGVSVEEVRALARDLFVPEKMSVAVVGDYEKLPW